MTVREKFETRFGTLRLLEQTEVPGVSIQITSPVMLNLFTGRVHPPSTAGAFLQDEELKRLIDALERTLRNLRRQVEP